MEYFEKVVICLLLEQIKIKRLKLSNCIHSMNECNDRG